MPGINYTRLDFQIAIRPAGDSALIQLSWPGQTHDYELALGELPGGPSELAPAALAQRLGLNQHLADWRAWLAGELARLPSDYTTLPLLTFDSAPQAIATLTGRLAGLLPRIALDVNDPALAAQPWEALLWPAVKPYLINRISPVRPNCLDLPLNLPLRFAHIDPQAPSIQLAVQKVLGHFGAAAVSEIAVVRETSLTGLDAARLAWQWPTAEVLHFDRFQPLAEAAGLLAVSLPLAAGTLGWFLRLANTWQTRLIVLNCATLLGADAAARLAQAIVARGGPAVLVASAAPPMFEQFYDHLLHDVPIDVDVLSALPPEPQTRLFGGMGREEALRISSIWLRLIGLHTALTQPSTADDRTAAADLSDLVRRARDLPASMVRGTLLNLANTMEPLVNTWPVVTFDRERNGLVPLQDIVRQMRAVAGVTGGGAPTAGPPPPPPAPRFVNSSLWGASPDGSLGKLDQATACLVTGETYLLGVQIGPKDVTVRTAGASALLEDTFKWTPGMSGVWVEIGVTGLDFEVLGSPVQALWLPQDRTPSESLFFSVIPRVAGAAWLRFCLYYQNNVIQSFRLAAITTDPGQAEPSADERRAALARALALPAGDIGEAGYLARLEYSLGDSVETLPSRPRRALSLVANDKDGDPVITLKTDERFAVHTDNKLKNRVAGVRAAFTQISTKQDPINRPELWSYLFGQPGAINASDAAGLEQNLKQLAETGWELYAAIFASDDGEALCAQLEKSDGEIIHVAHILLDRVIPWAAVYDRFYDAGKQEEAGQPVDHAACLAALPDADGHLPVTACGQHRACLLHPDEAARRSQAGLPQVVPATVACPLHLWGFKHIVEIPPQQVSQPGDEHNQIECILSAKPVKMAAGFNGSLALVAQHWTELQALQNLPAVSAAWEPCRYKRDEVLKLLADASLHLVYLYCHCRGGEAEPAIDPPFLEFQAPLQPGSAAPVAGRVTAGQLHGIRWQQHPLVFLNGCGTAAYSPDAQSPFVEQMVRDCHAAGVIGTEVTVWEALATEMARRFLTRFLAGASAGEALLLARREMLAQFNPLGLVYTLYAAAQLVLDRDADGHCT